MAAAGGSGRGARAGWQCILFFFKAEDGIRDLTVTGVQTCALPIYAGRPTAFAGADLVILPGSKDTIADLRFLKTEGFDRALAGHLKRGGAVGGICGGFQMLGRSVADPHGVESGGEEGGLGLLPVTTALEP